MSRPIDRGARLALIALPLLLIALWFGLDGYDVRMPLIGVLALSTAVLVYGWWRGRNA